jgi:hypothetical protein
MADASSQGNPVLGTDDPRETASVSNNGTTTPDPNTTDPPPRGGGNGDPK